MKYNFASCRYWGVLKKFLVRFVLCYCSLLVSMDDVTIRKFSKIITRIGKHWWVKSSVGFPLPVASIALPIGWQDIHLAIVFIIWVTEERKNGKINYFKLRLCFHKQVTSLPSQWSKVVAHFLPSLAISNPLTLMGVHEAEPPVCVQLNFPVWWVVITMKFWMVVCHLDWSLNSMLFFFNFTLFSCHSFPIHHVVVYMCANWDW